MSNFNTKQDENLASVRRLRMIAITDISSIAIDDNKQMTLTYTGVEAPIEMDFTFGTARFWEEDAAGAHGPAYKQNIVFTIPGDNLALLKKIIAQENRRFFVAVDYFDEEDGRIAGNIDKNTRGAYIGMVMKKDF